MLWSVGRTNWYTLASFEISPYSVSRIVLSIFLIHNFLKGENQNSVPTSPKENLQAQQAFDAWCRNSGAEMADVQGKRRDLENSSMREELTYLLQSRGKTRPKF